MLIPPFPSSLRASQPSKFHPFSLPSALRAAILCVQDGKNYGDEYLAELDYIEVLERLKEGYESDVVEEEEEESGEEKRDEEKSDGEWTVDGVQNDGEWGVANG